jgi:hypothetical protein
MAFANGRPPMSSSPAVSPEEAAWDHLDKHLVRLREKELREQAAGYVEQARELLMRAAHNYDHLGETAQRLHIHEALGSVDDSRSLAAERSGS